MSYAKIEEMGFFLPVVECKVRYLASARFEQELVLFSWIKEIQPLMALFAYRLEDKASGQLLLTGHTKHVCVTRSGEVQEIPYVWVESLAPELLGARDLEHND
ncbi:hypothetical protein HUU05_19890 [candidate division KSB1 bacterium]|nr:hypothetical protein [candidate division KSB1 bacterium]